ncbi:hypothetical protein ACEN17_10100 [Corynebacterium rouxii]|uniref:hypothetical protein n=1 Tax=Corynebacterium rouxii TaxID=2719119 RepID=UPI003CF71648
MNTDFNEESILKLLGSFVYKLSKVQLPVNFQNRKANDSVVLLENILKNTTAISSKSRGVFTFLKVIEKDKDTLLEIINKLNNLNKNIFFSHGDLKLGQFLKDSSKKHIYLCDWEECGFASELNDVCALGADIFYTYITSNAYSKLTEIKDHRDVNKVYDLLVQQATIFLKTFLKGFCSERGEKYSDREKEIIRLRLGIMGLYRLYTSSINSNQLNHKELAGASIGMHVALNGIDCF